MEVTFRKNLSRSYMCIREQKQPVEEYELQMLNSHCIPGFLPMQMIISEGKRRYLYDISGKQQMEDYFSGKKIGYGELKRFLISIQRACLNLSDYLLRENGICLEMEFIYVNLADDSLQFTYLPCYEKSLPEAFTSCMEQLLRKIDHQDKLAVELGYQIYQLCIRENADIRSIMANVLGESISIAEDINVRGKTMQSVDKRGKMCSARVENDEENGEITNHQKDNKEKEEKTNSKIEIRGKAKGFREIIEEKQRRMTEATEKFLSSFTAIGSSLFRTKTKKRVAKTCKHRKDVQFSEELKIINFSEEVDVSLHPTEILSVRQGGTLGKLTYRGLHQCADFQIEGDSFLLGKNSEQADGVISAEGVSRLHARISRKENRYFIEDLNSTNGTYLNDVALEYHEPQELKANDKVRFAAEEYVFL